MEASGFGGLGVWLLGGCVARVLGSLVPGWLGGLGLGCWVIVCLGSVGAVGCDVGWSGCCGVGVL